MNLRAYSFFEFLKDKKIAFIGMGISNFSTIKLFLEKELNVTVLDKKEQTDTQNARILNGLGAKFCTGLTYLDNLTEFDVVIRSPGVYFNNPKLLKAVKCGVVVTSEIEMFFDLCPCKTIGITGSDGKTTTTSLIYQYLKQEGKRVYLGGNIGLPIFHYIEKLKSEDIVVLELSSFQLLSLRRSPDIAVITNVSPNHLDVHSSMEEYISSKRNLILHQNAFSTSVLNQDNSVSASFEKDCRGKVYKFSRKERVNFGAFYDSKTNCYYFAKNGKVVELMHKNETSLIGDHNIENYLAAICCVYDLVGTDTIKEVSGSFKGVKHRNQFLGSVNGVRWYNDSIATSPTRTIAGLKSFDRKIILIAGGYDKNLSYTELAAVIVNRVKHLILMGDTADKISDAVVGNRDYDPKSLSVYKVGSMSDAVALANDISEPSDIVSLSPASASFDMYKNFEERGDHFARLVCALNNKQHNN